MVTSGVTGQLKVKMFDILGLVASASKISMLTLAPLGGGPKGPPLWFVANSS